MTWGGGSASGESRREQSDRENQHGGQKQTKEDVKRWRSRKRFQVEWIDEVKEKQGTQRRAGVSGKVKPGWRGNGNEWGGWWGGGGVTAPTGRAPRYKNKGQLCRAIPADELAGKYTAAQPSAPPTLESTLVGQEKTSIGGKQEGREGKKTLVSARQWETHDAGAVKQENMNEMKCSWRKKTQRALERHRRHSDGEGHPITERSRRIPGRLSFKSPRVSGQQENF